MLTGMQGQWLAAPRPVPSQEMGLRTPPEHLWRGRNRPRRRATRPIEWAWERQNRRNDSGPHRERKVPVERDSQ
jgi:hypothetical protein